jgi:hypothetical protein
MVMLEGAVHNRSQVRNMAYTHAPNGANTYHSVQECLQIKPLTTAYCMKKLLKCVIESLALGKFNNDF